MISREPASILIITDTKPLEKVLRKLTEQLLGNAGHVFSMNYSESPFKLTETLKEDTDFFVLELFRQLPGGIYAEGIRLAQRLAADGKGVLVISPLFLSQIINCRCYWDIASATTVIEQIESLLKDTRPYQEELALLARFFSPWTQLPQQHNI